MYCNATSKIQNMKTNAKLIASVGIKWVRTKRYSTKFWLCRHWNFLHLYGSKLIMEGLHKKTSSKTDFPNSHELWLWLREGFIYIMTKMFSVFVDSLILTATAAVRTFLMLSCQIYYNFGFVCIPISHLLTNLIWFIIEFALACLFHREKRKTILDHPWPWRHVLQ